MSCFCYVNKTFLIYMQLLKKSQQRRRKANERSRNPYSGDPPQKFSEKYARMAYHTEWPVDKRIEELHIRSFREKLETSVMTYS